MLLLAVALWSVQGAEPCRFEAGGPAPTRIELYTSEGCSSCPPADRWLSSLPDSPELLLLALHVDYWDSLGWPDRFAAAEYGARQRALVKREGGRVSYTPAVFREGRSWRAWTRGSDPVRDSGTPGPTLALEVHHLAPRTLRLVASGAGPGDAIHAAVTESRLSTDVRVGENRGRRLRHDHVVRAWSGTMRPGRAHEIALPQDLDPAQSRIVAWVEDREGHTLQGLTVPLTACAPDPR